MERVWSDHRVPTVHGPFVVIRVTTNFPVLVLYLYIMYNRIYQKLKIIITLYLIVFTYSKTFLSKNV